MSVKQESILYITGSFPRLGDGIGDAAGKLFDAAPDKERMVLVTTDLSEIREYVREKEYKNIIFVKNWKYKTIRGIVKKIYREHIHSVLIEYAGNGYKKDLAISFLPLLLRVMGLFSQNKTECHLRLHEFTMCRTARKLFTYPLILFCDHLDTPSYIEYKALKKKFGKKVSKSSIGSNFKWRTDKREFHHIDGDKLKVGFFGAIYPGKGIEKLIDIWENLEKKHPGKYEFQLLGGTPENLTHAFDDYNIKIKELIRGKGLEDKINISGFLPTEEMEKRLDEVDIAVLPYEDGLTLRRGSFLAFLGRSVAIVTTEGDEEAGKLFKDSRGVKMCRDNLEMISAIEDFSVNNEYYEAGLDNTRFQKYFDWNKIADKVIGCFKSK